MHAENSVLIKRYANRKLYYPARRSYVTLADIASLIQEGVDVQVQDHTSGEDLTARIYAQVLFELQKKETGSLPEQVLGRIIQAGEEGWSRFRSTLINSSDLAELVDTEIRARLEVLAANGDLGEAQAQHLETLLLVHSQRLRILAARFHEGELVTRDTVQDLRSQISILEKRLDDMQR